jgi:hypothetical protein
MLQGFLLFPHVVQYTYSRNSSVGMATDYGQDDKKILSSSSCKVKNYHFSRSFTPAVGHTQPLPRDTRYLSPEIKRLERVDDYTPPTNARVKGTRICISILAQCLISSAEEQFYRYKYMYLHINDSPQTPCACFS